MHIVLTYHAPCSVFGADLWWQSGLGFLCGAVLSATCGWCGMLIAVKVRPPTRAALAVFAT